MLHLLVPQYITPLIWAYQSPHAFCTILAFSIHSRIHFLRRSLICSAPVLVY